MTCRGCRRRWASCSGREPVFAILKGRRNYLCLNKVHGTGPDEPEDSLFDPRSVSAIGRQVTRLHEWAATTDTGDRDELVPGVDDRAWRQVSVNARECIGAQKCPFGTQCFAEQAREAAGEADIVVTNHALLAIDAMENYIVLPEHDVVVIDEAHDLVDRVTSVASGELSASAVEAAVRRCGRLVGEDLTGRLRDAAEGLALALADTQAGRLDVLAEQLEVALATVRDAAAACAADLRSHVRRLRTTRPGWSATRAATVALDEVAENAGRMIAAFARGDRRAAGGGLAGPAGERRVVPARHAAGRAASGRRAARGAAVQAAHGRADLGDADTRRLVRAAGAAVGPAADGRRRVAAPPRCLRARRAGVVGCRRRVSRPEPEDGCWPGPGWMSARRSIIAAAASCTSRGTCRRLVATACLRLT